MSWLWLLPLLGAAWFGLNFAIRRGLTAARVLETAEPAGLPWREVVLPTANGKQLFAWFIPADQPGPALVVMHGWGGNAEMMLPLAAPCMLPAMLCCCSMPVATGAAMTIPLPRCPALPKILRPACFGWPSNRQ